MKGNSSIYKKGELTGNRTTERAQARSRSSIEKNRKKTEETIKGREKREREQEYIKKVFKETETRAKQIADTYYMEGSNKMENNRKKTD